MTIPLEKLRRLRAQAHGLKPLVQIGKEGVTEAQVETIKRHLDHHELIKVKFNEHKDQRRELSAIIAEKTGSEQVSLTGNTLTLYRANHDPAKRKVSP
jgi:RNA-binding protein